MRHVSGKAFLKFKLNFIGHSPFCRTCLSSAAHVSAVHMNSTTRAQATKSLASNNSPSSPDDTAKAGFSVI